MMKRKYVLLLSLIAVMNFCEGQTGGNRNNDSVYFVYGPGKITISEVEPANEWGRKRNLTFKVSKWAIMSPPDTSIPTPDTTLRKLLIAGEERNNLKRQVRNLEEQIKLLNDVIKEQVAKDVIQSEYFANQMKNLQDQLALCKEQVKAFENIVRRERRKRRLVTFGGILTTGAALFLSLKK